MSDRRRQTAHAPCEADGLPARCAPACALHADRQAGLPAALDVAGVESLNLDALERQAVGEAIRRCDGNQARAARLLGISRNTLRRRIKAYDLVEGSALVKGSAF